jgi:hypothetical protein
VKRAEQASAWASRGRRCLRVAGGGCEHEGSSTSAQAWHVGRSSSGRARHGVGKIRPGAVRRDPVGLRRCPYLGASGSRRGELACPYLGASGSRRGELHPGASSGSGARAPATGERRSTCELREGSERAASSEREAHPLAAGGASPDGRISSSSGDHGRARRGRSELRSVVRMPKQPTTK